MPFGSYEPSDSLAVENAMRLVKEAGMNAIKLEGGKRMAPRVKAIVESGIPVPLHPHHHHHRHRPLMCCALPAQCSTQVMGHVGLTPQSIHSLGGFKVQGTVV